MSERYQKSERLLERAERSIPLGSQTFSKSRTQFPHGVSPFFIERGKGSRVWDVDGNEYVDFINGLLSVTLGYCDPDVDAAVKAQLENGVSFSLAHPLEMQVAEKIIELAPCAEKVRFGKNGSDATAGAIRLARAFTGRERVAVCGYHGWQDWYIGSTARHLGVPEAVRDLTHTFAYNDLPSLETLLASHENEFAAVIMEPMNISYPDEGYLQAVKDLVHRHGALLVFDETITGFRFDIGGAQQLLGVTPDLATFGKGLANGYPLSAVAGRADVMKLMEEIFFSFTFGGETLSLAAALAVMTKLQNEPVLETIKAQGEKLMKGLGQAIEQHGCAGFAEVAGHPSWSFFVLKDQPEALSYELKTLLEQEMFATGVLYFGTHNMSFAHSDEDIARLLAAYDRLLPMLKEAVEKGSAAHLLRCKPLVPLFKVR